jgi:hypothetical protein
MTREAVADDFLVNAEEEAAATRRAAITAKRKATLAKKAAAAAKRKAAAEKRSVAGKLEDIGHAALNTRADRQAIAFAGSDRYGPPPAPTAAPAKARGNGKKPPRRRQSAGNKPSIGLPDPLLAAQEEALHFKEGNRKLGLVVEALREGLEVITVAEWDRKTNRPVSADDLRKLAVAALDRYSAIIGQSWRTHRLTGPTLAGGTGNAPVHASKIPDNPPEE